MCLFGSRLCVNNVKTMSGDYSICFGCFMVEILM